MRIPTKFPTADRRGIYPMEHTVSRRYLFTSESVTEGHPDKVCDQISDAVVDAIYSQDPEGRVACEVALSPGLVLLMGEISTTADIDLIQIVRNVVSDIGYTDPEYGLDGAHCAVLTTMTRQSPDIARGVDLSLEIDDDPLSAMGAGDQGIVFGYACRETPELMPLTIALSHDLAKRLADVRKTGVLPYLRPDGKTQVTVEYEGHTPVRIDAIVVSAQHGPEIDLEQIKRDVLQHVVNPVVPENLLDENTRFFVNPTGRFVIGGPAADAGLTGRKIIVDTYGGVGRHGGGAFSGKDPTKVDRSGSYACRWIAKNIVAAGLADRCEVQVAYAIGVARPVSVFVDTFGTSKVDETVLSDAVASVFDLRPAAMIKRLQLKRPIYRQVSSYGHFGRTDVDVPWEKIDMTEQLKQEVMQSSTARTDAGR